jgi:hypothetical protein
MNRLLWPAALLSLVVSIGLAGALTRGVQRAAAEARAKPTAAPPLAAAPAAPTTGAVWPSLQSEELPELVARLRAAGFPPEIVRAMVRAEVARQYAARRKALDPDADTRPAWKRGIIDPKIQLALRQLDREQQKLLRELLGADAEGTDPMSLYYRDRRFGPLPPEKGEEVRAILRDFDDKRSDIFIGFTGGTLLPADRDKMTALDRQLRETLAKVLTPAELEDYDLRSSNTANSLRYELAAFNATEDEFRTLYRLKKVIDEQFGLMYAQPSQGEMRRRGELQKDVNDQIRATLGEARYAEYERATNYEYRNTSQLVARLELPPATTAQLWDLRKEFMDRIAGLRTASPEQQLQQRAALNDEALAKLTPMLGGSRGLEAYKQYGGSWLRSLQPRPAAKN